jgi:hypothetical protein
MHDANYIEHTAQTTARLKTKFVAGYYLLTIVTSIVILFVHGRLAFATDLVAAVFYLAVTALLYDRSQPKPRSLRWLAALIHAIQENL